MPNRYQRDELIKIGLDMAQSPNLKVHDCPNGVVSQDAYAIQWLQDIIDFWYNMIPFSSGVKLAALNLTANTNDVTLPLDFILDVRNGYIIQTTDQVISKRRTKRVPLQKWINRDLSYQSQVNVNNNTVPLFYTILGTTLKITPQYSIDRNAWLWYYFLPTVLQSDDTPLFPNDYVLTEYIRIRALEWTGRFDPGTAQKFCDKIVTGMKANGLMNEPEDDEIPFDDLTYSRSISSNPYSWMGAR